MDPSSSALPGRSTIQLLTNGLGWWALVASLIGLVLGAAAWAVGSHSNNYQYATSGRKAVLVSGAAALVIGAAPTFVNFLFQTGHGIHKPSDLLALLGHARAAVTALEASIGRWDRRDPAVDPETVGALSNNTLGGVFEGVGGAGLANLLTKALLGGFFGGC